MGCNQGTGRVMVPPLNRMVSFRTVRPNRASDAKKESQETAPTLLSTLSASAKDGHKKVRVLRNVKSGDLHLLNTNLEADVGDGSNTDLKTPNLLRRNTHSLTHYGLSRYGLGHLDAIDITTDSVTHAAFEDGQRIEYFSATHNVWMSGTVNVEVCPSDGSDLQHCIRYHVTLANGQLREDVGLDVLRSPFGPNELVEVSSGQPAGLQLPAANVIASDQSLLLPQSCYRVLFKGTGQSTANVPPLKLKRRFPRGRYVEVYRGSEIGWQMAKVHHSASSDGCNAETLPLPALTAQAGVLIAYGMIERVNFTPRVSGSSNEAQSGASQLAIWTSVPICEVSEEEAVTPEYVPSYLLRLSTISQI